MWSNVRCKKNGRVVIKQDTAEERDYEQPAVLGLGCLHVCYNKAIKSHRMIYGKMGKWQLLNSCFK